MTRDEARALDDALAHLEMVQRHALHGLDDRLVVDAVCMRLSAGLESLSQLPAETREEILGTDWKLMWGMRNRVAHGCLLVDAAIVEQTVARDVSDHHRPDPMTPLR